MKKIFSVFILFLTIGTSFATPDFSVRCSSGQLLWYRITNTTNHEVEIVYQLYPGQYYFNSGSQPTGFLVIPDSVYYNGYYYTVTSISHGAFYGCNGLDGKLVIPNTVRQIGSKAFYGCTGIDTLILGNGIITIGSNAFEGCNSLTGSLVIPNSVSTIGDQAFVRCSGFTGQLVIPNSVTSIGASAFEGCSGFTGQLVIPNSVTSIGNSAFNGCSGFTGPLVISNGITIIPQSAFQGCSGLTGQLVIPNLVTTIEDYAFKECNHLDGKLIIPNNVTTIGSQAFYNCSQLDTLNIGVNVTTIGNHAFQGCSEIKQIFYNAQNCSSQLCYPSTAPFYGDIQSNLEHLIFGNDVQTIPDYAFTGCGNLDGTLIIPNNVVTIGSEAFSSCTGLDALEIGVNVTTIGSYAFQGCTGLDGKLIIPNNVETIGGYAFRGCTGLNGKLVIPNNVYTIGGYAFYGCLGIDSLEIGVNVATIGNYAFQGCSGIHYMLYNARNCTSQLCYPSTAPFYGDIQSNLRYLILGNDVQTIPYYAFYYCAAVDTLEIGVNVATIGKYAFQGCSGVHYMLYNAKDCTTALCDATYSPSPAPFCGAIQSNLHKLIIGDSVQKIPNSAFRGCSSLNGTLIIPNNVTTIGNYAFYGCSGIDTLDIGVNVATIGNSAFQQCSEIQNILYNARNCTTQLCNTGSYASPFGGSIQSNLYHVVLGDSVQTIPSCAFEGCSNLDGRLIIPDNVITIGSYAFNACSGIDTVEIGTNVSTIGWAAFYGCRSLNQLNLPNSVTTIGGYAFRGCTGLNGKLIIPNNVETIGEYAFYGCSGIDSLEIGVNVATIGDYAFQGCSGIHYMLYNALNCTTQLCYNNTSPFYGDIQSNLQQLVVGNSVQLLPNYAFRGCVGLSGQLEIPNNVTTIGDFAFSGCTNIISLNISNASADIGQSAFANCDRLVTVNLGDSVRSIGNSAFQNCFRLNSLQMGNAVTRIGDNGFNGCVRLPFPNLSSALTHIGSSAFQGCSLVQGDITIPAHVDTIGDNAFTGCGVISSITMQPVVPPTIFANTFDAATLSVPVYVPCNSYLQYYVTNYWENFPNLQGGQPFEVALSANNAVMGEATLTTPPTCSNYSAVITATAYNGFHFVRWNDGNSVNPRLVNLTQDTSFVAEFSANNAYITVHSADSVKGSVSGGGLYPYNGLVVLTATPNATFHFLRWSDGNTDNPRYLFATQDSSFTAIFVSNASYITVGNFNPEMGTVSGGGLYYYQQQISIMATPNYGYHFVQWNDGNMQNPRSIIVNCDTSFMAYFAPNIYAISVNSNNTTMGTVTGTGNYHYNMFISISATANYGYHFSSWNDGNTNNPRTLTVTRDSAFTAQFAANTYQITVTPNDPLMGGAYGSGTYTYNSQTTISALPTYGYHFVQWNDGSTENPRTISVTQNAEYEAQFAINFYTITVGSNNPAIGSASGSGNYSYNSIINLVATPNYGYHFTQWSDGNTDNPRTVTVMQNATYTAQFAINSYTITVGQNSAAMGMVAGNGNYIYNTLATITATPYYGYHFTQWNDGNTENPRTVVVSQDMSFTAQFDYNSYNVSAISNNITAGYTTGSGTYNYNSIVALTAISAPHYHFVVWSDSVSENPRNIVVVNDTVYTAIFSIDQHTVSGTSNNSVMGAVQGTGSYDYGSHVTLSAVPNYGYHFIQWNDGSTQNPRHVSLVSDTSFVAMFGINSYSAVIMSSDTVMGSVNGSGTYNYQTQLTLMATPNYGYHFVQWSDGSTDNPRLLTITRDTVVLAVFAINIYQVDLSVNDSTLGEVFGAGAYTYQSQVVISASANEHCHFLQWSDGNTSNPRQITVIQNVALTAQFEEDERFLVQVVSSDDNMGSVTGGGEYYVGTQIRIEANPNPHYNFVHWMDGVTDNPRFVTVLEDITYTAVFSPEVYEIVVNSSDESMGTASGGGAYPYGSVIEIRASAYDGYHFVRWSDGDSNITRTILVENNASYTAEFGEGVSVVDWGIRDVQVYPNPTNDMIFVISDENINYIEIINLSGQVVQSVSQQNWVPLHLLPSGTYIMRFKIGDSIVNKKIVKQ